MKTLISLLLTLTYGYTSADGAKLKDLSREEIDLITDFIENGLYDPDLVRYVPESVLSGNCIPNNDPQSRIDLGCED